MKFSAKFILPLLIIALAAMGARHLIQSRPKAKKAQREVASALVEVLPVRRGDARVIVEGSGAVSPAQSVLLQPEVGGRIVEISDRLMPGSVFREGELLARIDERDYRFAAEARKAEAARADLELKMEESRAAIARREWSVMGAKPKTDPAGEALALREPQRAAARAAQSAAQGGLEQAMLNLDRTKIRAPFNAVVLEEYVDVGQSVSPQTPIAKLAGSDRYWAMVSLPVEHLEWIEFPEEDRQSPTRAIVTQRLGSGRLMEREGRAIRRLGDLDPAGRMARVLVSIDDPLSTSEESAPVPLLIGSYVNVAIEGPILKDVAIVPRRALRGEDRLWIMDENDRLRFHTVTVLWKTREEVFVRNGLENGTRIVVSALAAPIEGMPLWTESDQPVTRP